MGGGEREMFKKSDKVIREALGAGRWFPGSQTELNSMVRAYMAEAKTPELKGPIVSAIAPHAGYVYSGKVAGYTFRAIMEDAAAGHRPETVVILGLSHRGGFKGVALMDGDAVSTPLGEVEIDKEALKELTADSSRIFADYAPHAGEHSAENEIPFVQAALPGAKIVVGIFGDHDSRTVDDLVTALEGLSKKKKILVVASTDMLHDADYELVKKTDKATLEKVVSMDYSGIEKDWSYSRQVFCGLAPVVTAMKYAALKGCAKGTVLYYRNSGDDFPEGRGRWVVGYCAAVFTAANSLSYSSSQLLMSAFLPSPPGWPSAPYEIRSKSPWRPGQR